MLHPVHSNALFDRALRSVSDNNVICQDGEFYKLPDHIRDRAPLQGLRRGEIDKQ